MGQKWLITAASFVLFVLTTSGQQEGIKLFGENEGLSYPFLYSVNQDTKGNIIIGTGEGLYVFNGLTFKEYKTEKGLANNFVQTGFTDKKGNIWLGHNNGSVTCYDGQNLRAIDLSLYAKSRVNRITEDSENRIWVVTQNDGLIKINAEGDAKSYYKDFIGQLCYSGTGIPTGGILVAKEDGLFVLNEKGPKEDTFEKKLLNTEDHTIVILSDFVKNKAFAISEEGFLFEILSENKKITIKKLDEISIGIGDVTGISSDPAGHFWLCSKTEGVLKLNPNTSPPLIEKINLPNDFNTAVQLAFTDREGILWLGTYGKGLAKITSNYLHHLNLDADKKPVNVNFIAPNGNELWISTESGIYVIDKKNCFSSNAIRKLSKSVPPGVTSLAHTSDQQIWISTEDRGAFKATLLDTVFKPIDLGRDRLSNNGRQVCNCGQKMFIGTAAGLFQLDMGGRVEKKLTIIDGLQHNSIKTLYCREGNLWVATEGGGLSTFDTQNGILRNQNIQTVAGNIFSISSSPSGNVFLATEGNGIVVINNAETKVYVKEDGLFSNYCESIAMINDETVLITHIGGISIFKPNNRQITSYSDRAGFKHEYSRNAIFADSAGVTWIGTNSGLVRYDNNLHRRNEVEPTVVIESIKVGDSFSSKSEVSKLPHGIYNIQIDWSGISHLNPENVTFSHFLDGHGQGWSKPSTDRTAVLSGLQSGSYLFRIKAFNADGYGGITEATIPIFIDKPFWLKSWFVVLMFLTVSSLIYIFWRRKESVLIRYQKQLESEIQDKTKEITEQKEMLEMRNKDITDSIQYAKNIQKALLPARGKLLDWLPESFVFYKPRDIVSGDFYWVEQFGNRLIIACADCTGHGVPGAIMAVLGSSILREISRNPNVDTTSVALQALDRELRQLLQKSGSDSGVDDGMDILLADIHLDSGKVFFSSARRPLLILREGEAIMFKGDKTPVGGGLYDQDREFALQFVQLNEGDGVYFFSDGIIDQFGGPMGKKLKTTGFVEFLLSIENHDMATQYALLRSFFMNWKGIHDQVDDVIVIGFRW